MSENYIITHSVPIPEIFYSDKKQQPFQHCRLCGESLLQSNKLYIIEKAYERNAKTREPELVFEFAACLNCYVDFGESISKESRKKLDDYYAEYADLNKRDAELKKHNLLDPEIWINNCIVKNTPIDQAETYVIYALCWKDELVFEAFPYMVCGEAMEEIVELLSSKSLDLLTDFLADLIDVPPEFEEILKSSRLVLL